MKWRVRLMRIRKVTESTYVTIEAKSRYEAEARAEQSADAGTITHWLEGSSNTRPAIADRTATDWVADCGDWCKT